MAKSKSDANAVLDYLKGELGDPAYEKAASLIGDAGALLAHLEHELPMASLGQVQKMLGVEL